MNKLEKNIYDCISPNGYDDFHLDQVERDAKEIAAIFNEILNEILRHNGDVTKVEKIIREAR